MLYVKAIAGDIWPTAPLQPIGEVVLEKQLVRAHERGSWGGNGAPVAVFPGLVVSYRDPAYARWWLEQPHRAQPVIVDAGEVVVFYEDADALWFVEQGQAELVSEEEVKSYEAGRAAQGNVLKMAAKAAKRAVG